MQVLSDIHGILFNAILIYSGILGVWAIIMSARNRSISGNFWGAIGTLTILSLVTLLVGTVLALRGYLPAAERLQTYFIYMAWIVIIIPGIFTQLRGRDDPSAAMAFALISIFNLFVGLSMQSRGLVGPWLPGA